MIASCTPKRSNKSHKDGQSNLVHKAVIIHSTQQLYDYVQSITALGQKIGIRCLHSSIVSGYEHVLELYNQTQPMAVPKLYICESDTHKYQIIDNILRLLNPNYNTSQRNLTRINVNLKETKNLNPGSTYYYEYYVDNVLFAQSLKKTIFSDNESVNSSIFSGKFNPKNSSLSNGNVVPGVTVNDNGTSVSNPNNPSLIRKSSNLANCSGQTESTVVNPSDTMMASLPESPQITSQPVFLQKRHHHNDDSDEEEITSISWSDTYVFDHLPEFKLLKIKCYEHKKKRNKPHLLGTHKFSFEELLERPNIDEWCQLENKHDSYFRSYSSQKSDTPDINGSRKVKEKDPNAPMSRLTIKTEHALILPLIHYKIFSQFLNFEFFNLCTTLESKISTNDKHSLGKYLLRYFISIGKVNEYLTELVFHEVEKNIENHHLILRQNSLASKSVEHYLHLVGNKFMEISLFMRVRYFVNMINL